MALINYVFDESNHDINPEVNTELGEKKWLTYRWGYIKDNDNLSVGEWHKTWHKIEEPTFTERDINADPLSQYRGEYMGMPIKDFLLISIQEDLDMLLLEKQVFMKEFNERYSEIVKEAVFVKKNSKNKNI